MPNKISFTKRKLETLPLPPLGKRTTYFDVKAPGLAVRITATGTKTFVVYRKVNGRPERIALGRFPAVTVEQARKMAAEVNAVIAKGGNPNDKRRTQRAEITLGDLYQEYLEHHIKARGKRIKNPESYFKLYLSQWQHRKLSALKRSDVRTLHNRLGREKGHTTANKTLVLLKAMYNKAIEWELFKGETPCDGIQKLPEKSRDRFLQADELPRFFQALAEEPNETARDFFLMCLLTGARRANVLAMRWEEINFERATWTIPTTKNGEAHTVPLMPEALTLLESRRYANGESDWVFPGTGASGHLVEPKKAWARILKRAGIQDLRIHDLRRSLGSWQAATGANLSIIGKTLAHKNVSTTAIYARLNLDPVRDSMQLATRAMLEAAGVLPKAEIAEISKKKLG
ncbi:tyrosine-type recombinase/integrase [Nitrosococcus wardiae]|uniref:Site-specific integrase n=1 Tax=Nitrosococcus wardiae TaxID=1814290 RepID=A0A4V1AVJ9_9GAMM|nr:site-specific integrase [Nitrosococcus wardiae]QBQ53395.1 site-specific integrase [Nitrosococcus wardiae]